MMAPPGSAMDSRVGLYSLGERLGSGGMAEVYVGHSGDGSGRRFAIKRILPQLARDARFVAMFCDEARICAALDHPNIVKVLDFGEQDGELFMAMEYIEGTSCARLLRTVAARGKRVPIEVAIYIVRQVLSALVYAHEAVDERGRALGIVHRDVSPGNILVSRLGEVKLSDFGIVRSEFIARRTYPGELKGKIGYMSPEQVVGADVDARSDLFALGIVLAELLLTRPLFPGRSEMEILTRIYEADLRVLDHHADELPSKMVDILRFVLSRRTQERPASARVMAEQLDAFCTETGLRTHGGMMVEWMVTNDLLPTQSALREVSPSPEGRGALQAQEHGAEQASGEAPVDADTESPPGRSSVRAACPTFEVRMPNQEIIGPFGSAELVERFATRRLPLSAYVRRNDGRFRPARTLPELSSVLAVETWLDGVLSARHAVRSELDRTRLPTYLYGLVQRRQSGALVLVDGARRLVTVWEGGQPMGAISSDRDLLLGARLVSEGLITEAQLNEALEQLVAPQLAGRALGGRLGEALMQRRLVSAADLLRVLVSQLEARIVGLGAWETGEIWFVENAGDFAERLCTSTSALALIASGVRSGFSGKELARVLAALGDSPIAANPVAPFPTDSLGLTRAELAALTLAPGARSMGRFLTEAVCEHGMRGDDVLRAVFIGLSAAVLVSPGWPWR